MINPDNLINFVLFFFILVGLGWLVKDSWQEWKTNHPEWKLRCPSARGLVRGILIFLGLIAVAVFSWAVVSVIFLFAQ